MDHIAGYKMVLITLVFFTGLAFAVLSSVHPVFGLYGSLFPALVYAIFGMGRHVATGNNACFCFSCRDLRSDQLLLVTFLTLLLKTQQILRPRHLTSCASAAWYILWFTAIWLCNQVIVKNSEFLVVKSHKIRTNVLNFQWNGENKHFEG